MRSKKKRRIKKKLKLKEEPEGGDESSTTGIASKLLSLEKERSTTWSSHNI